MATIQLRENQTLLPNGELDPTSGTVVPNHYLVDGALYVTREGQTIEELLVEPEVPPLPAYILSRKAEYPPIDDLIVALWENVVEERAASVIELEAKRQAVKTKYPKS